MADVYLSEYAELAKDSQGRLINNAPQEPPIATPQKKLIGAEIKFTAVNKDTKFVQIIADGAFHMNIGADATVADKKIPADVPLLFGVSDGDIISVITP